MNISNLSNQIEIAFWTGVVSLLRPRKSTRLITITSFLLLCLVALLLMAFTFFYKGRTSRSLEAKSAAVHMTPFLGRPDNGQENLLLILVDQVDATEPRLQGVWMLIHDPSGNKVYFMPIYPAQSEFGQDVKQSVGMGKISGLAPELEQVLQREGLWWDNFLIIDRETLASLVQLAGGIDLEDGRLDGQQVIGLLPIADQDAQTALDLQARIAQGVCQRFDSMVQNESPQALFELLIGGGTQSVYSDLTHSELLTSWNRLKKAGGMSCYFPTLIGR